MDTTTQNLTADGVPVVHMWEAGHPNLGEPGAGFPLLANARHVQVYRATRETGAYNHHSKLTWHDGLFHAMWSNHPHGEDGPGQRILHGLSADGVKWSFPKELFPSPGPVLPSEQPGLALTALKWLEFEGRLFAVAALHENIGFTDFDRRLPPVAERDATHPARARRGYSPLVREVMADDGAGPIFPLRTVCDAAVTVDLVDHRTAGLADGGAALREFFGVALGTPAWDFEGVLGFPKAYDGHRLCEPTVYRAADGQLVMLLRDAHHTHRLFVSVSRDDGQSWSCGRPTDIPDSPSLSCALTLGDGTVLLVGNQMAAAFDNPLALHYKRDPLMVSVSSDGQVFSRAYALRCGKQSFRVAGVLGRGGGGQYPSAIIQGDRLYVQYSMGKEDIWVSSVELGDLGL